LNEFIGENSHSRVPQRFKTNDGFALGTWLQNRRGERRKGRLSGERIAELSKLGILWHHLDERWELGIKHLQEFIKEHDHSNVPGNFQVKNSYNLGIWVGNTRNKRKAGKLNQDKINQLDALGFLWTVKVDYWDLGLKHLKDFVKKEGHAIVERSFITEDGFPLGSWVQTKRKQRKKGRLSAESIAELNKLGFIWDQKANMWKIGVSHLKEHIKINGNGQIPQNLKSPDGYPLGLWCYTQRQARKKGRISSERISILDDLSFIWEPRKQA
jgi:hypothetical protein